MSFVFTDITADGISACFRPGAISTFINVNQGINTTSNETQAPWGSSTLPGKQKGSFLLLSFSHLSPLSLPSSFTVSPQSPSQVPVSLPYDVLKKEEGVGRRHSPYK